MLLPKDSKLSLVNFQDVERGADGLRFYCHAGDREIVLEEQEVHYSVQNPGYVNLRHGDPVYGIRRAQRRDYRQGLRPSQYSLRTESRARGVSSMPGDFLVENRKAMAKALRREYITFPEALESVEERPFGRAFSQFFALDKEMRIRHRGTLVGDLNQDGVIVLRRNYQFLQEALVKAAGVDHVQPL